MQIDVLPPTGKGVFAVRREPEYLIRLSQDEAIALRNDLKELQALSNEGETSYLFLRQLDEALEPLGVQVDFHV